MAQSSSHWLCWELHKGSCRRKHNFLMDVGSSSHIPHQISLQTAESLGLEKDLLVSYADFKSKEPHNGCGVAVWTLFIVCPALYITSFSTVYTTCPWTNWITAQTGRVCCKYPLVLLSEISCYFDLTSRFHMWVSTERELNGKCISAFTLCSFTSPPLTPPADTKITLNSRKSGWQK